MAITTKILAGDVADMIGGDFVDYDKVYLWIEWNLEEGQAVLDTANNKIRLGSSNITVNSDGTWSRVGLITFDSADVQPTELLYRVHWQYPDDHVTGGRATGNSGWLKLMNADPSTVQLTAAMVVDYVPASWMTDAIATLQTYVDAGLAAETGAEAAQAAAEAAITGLGVGTTTTGAPGTPASVTLTGTAPDRDFNFTIPEGEQGLPGPGAAAWTATQAVTVGSVRQAPDGSWIKSTADRTTRSSFDATEQGFWATTSATSGTLEQLALSATIDTQTLATDADDASPLRVQQDARIEGTIATLAPPKELVPAASAHFFGHSYISGVYAAVDVGGPGQALAPTVAELLGLPLRNEGIGGSLLSDSLRGWAPILQKIIRTDPDGSGRNGNRFIPGAGLRLLMHGFNDLGTMGAAAMASFVSALYVAVSRMRASAIFENSHSSVVLAGATWSTLASSVRYSGSVFLYCISNAGTIQITTPADFPGGTIALGFTTHGTSGGGGLVTSPSIAGVVYTLDTTLVARPGWYTSSVMRIANVPAGAHSYTFTLSGVTGTVGVAFDYWQWEPAADEGPLVVLVEQPKPIDYAAYSPTVVTDANVDTLNGYLRTAATDFGGQRVITVDTSAIDHDATCFIAGNIHPTLKGHRLIAQAIADRIAPLVRYQATPSQRAPRVEYDTTYPTSAYGPASNVGDRVVNLDPVTTAVPGWVCTVAGTPGTWVPEATLNTGTPLNVTHGSAIPTTGTFAKGDLRLNDTTIATGVSIGWICTVGGTPGTWKPLTAKASEGEGQATLVAGTKAVTGLAAVTANTQIELFHLSINGGTPGAVFVSAKTVGTGFTISSTSASDTSIVGWRIVKY